MNGKRYSILRVFLIGVCVVFALAGSALSQTVSGTLRGTVKDANGAFVPNASVIARSTKTGLERSVVMSEEESLFVRIQMLADQSCLEVRLGITVALTAKNRIRKTRKAYLYFRSYLFPTFDLKT